MGTPCWISKPQQRAGRAGRGDQSDLQPDSEAHACGAGPGRIHGGQGAPGVRRGVADAFVCFSNGTRDRESLSWQLRDVPKLLSTTEWLALIVGAVSWQHGG